MTAYRLTPVGASGPERERAVVVENPSKLDLLAENQRLKEYLEASQRDVAGWRAFWDEEVGRRVRAQQRLNRATRVLASLARLSPRMADVVAAAGREIYQMDRTDRLRQARAERRAREIWRLDE